MHHSLFNSIFNRQMNSAAVAVLFASGLTAAGASCTARSLDLPHHLTNPSAALNSVRTEVAPLLCCQGHATSHIHLPQFSVRRSLSRTSYPKPIQQNQNATKESV